MLTSVLCSLLGEKYQNRASMKWCFSAEKLHTSQKANFQACDKHMETELNSLIGLLLSFLLADVNLGFIISFSTAHSRPFISVACFVPVGSGKVWWDLRSSAGCRARERAGGSILWPQVELHITVLCFPGCSRSWDHLQKSSWSLKRSSCQQVFFLRILMHHNVV